MQSHLVALFGKSEDLLPFRTNAHPPAKTELFGIAIDTIEVDTRYPPHPDGTLDLVLVPFNQHYTFAFPVQLVDGSLVVHGHVILSRPQKVDAQTAVPVFTVESDRAQTAIPLAGIADGGALVDRLRAWFKTGPNTGRRNPYYLLDPEEELSPVTTAFGMTRSRLESLILAVVARDPLGERSCSVAYVLGHIDDRPIFPQSAFGAENDLLEPETELAIDLLVRHYDIRGTQLRRGPKDNPVREKRRITLSYDPPASALESAARTELLVSHLRGPLEREDPALARFLCAKLGIEV